MPVVRRMEEKDIAAVAALERAAFVDAWTEKGIYDTFCQKQAYIFVAVQDGELVGYCIVYQVPDEAEIARIAVDPSFRRQGVGRSLLEAVRKECKTGRINRLLLDVRKSNHEARVFYSHYGFREDGVRKNFYDLPKEDAILMSMAAVSTGNAKSRDL